MTTTISSDPRARDFPLAGAQRTARIAGAWFLLTFVFSIPAALLYAPVPDDPTYILGAGADLRVQLGAFLEVLLAIATIATAVVLFPVLKRQSESIALGYVACRVLESTVIVMGLISLLGPAFCAGFGNGLLLGYLMFRSGLVPRPMALIGLIGGPIAFVKGFRPAPPITGAVRQTG